MRHMPKWIIGATMPIAAGALAVAVAVAVAVRPEPGAGRLQRRREGSERDALCLGAVDGVWR
jgi:hypothetical protein